VDLPPLDVVPRFLVSFQTTLYYKVYQLLHETSFQIINISLSNCEKRDSELMRQKLLMWRCELYVDSAEP